jgi:hypothetical protein
VREAIDGNPRGVERGYTNLRCTCACRHRVVWRE